MVNGLDWQCCLAGSSKTAPRILIFSIAMGADYSYEVKNIEIWVPTFFKHINSFVATVIDGHFLLQFLIETIIKNNRSVRTKAVNVFSLGSEYSNILFLVSFHKTFLYTTGELTFNVDLKGQNFSKSIFLDTASIENELKNVGKIDPEVKSGSILWTIVEKVTISKIPFEII